MYTVGTSEMLFGVAACNSLEGTVFKEVSFGAEHAVGGPCAVSLTMVELETVQT